MVSDHLNVRVTGVLREHLRQQVGEAGLYESTSEYVRDLIRRDLKDRRESWKWLADELDPAVRAGESCYLEVTAEDVIGRNKKRSGNLT